MKMWQLFGVISVVLVAPHLPEANAIRLGHVCLYAMLVYMVVDAFGHGR